MYYQMAFFTNVLNILQKKGKTKKWLAEQANISNSFITDVTKGGNLSLEKMVDIANALEVPLPFLLIETDLDRHALLELTKDEIIRLPSGYEWVTAPLSSRRAFIVRKWAEETKEKLNLLGDENPDID